jgi:hypothetical protein
METLSREEFSRRIKELKCLTQLNSKELSVVPCVEELTQAELDLVGGGGNTSILGIRGYTE